MTSSEKNWSLSIRGLIIGLSLSILASLIIGLPITQSAIDHLKQQQLQLHQTLTKQVSLQAAEAIFSQDYLSLNVILAAITEDESVHYAAVYDLNNELMAEQGAHNDAQSQPISIQYQNEVIGLLEIRLNSHSVEQSTLQLYGLWFVLSLIFAILATLAGWFIGRTLGRKLDTSCYELEHLGAIKQVTQHATGELKTFTQALSKLHENTIQQKNAHQALAQYMPAQLTPSWHERQLILEHDYSQGAVLMFKIANLEQAQQTFSKSDLANTLNHYFQLIQQAAKLYNGSVTSYEHGGILALFDQAQNDGKHNFHGICTGLLVLGILKNVYEQRQKDNLPILEFKLALHCGDILSRRLPDPTQVDAQPWLAMNNDREACHGAALLCEQSEANALLVSKTAIEQGQLASQLNLHKHHNLIALNQAEPVVSYWVDQLSPNYQALIDRQVEHLGAQLPQIN